MNVETLLQAPGVCFPEMSNEAFCTALEKRDVQGFHGETFLLVDATQERAMREPPMHDYYSRGHREPVGCSGLFLGQAVYVAPVGSFVGCKLIVAKDVTN